MLAKSAECRLAAEKAAKDREPAKERFFQAAADRFAELAMEVTK